MRTEEHKNKKYMLKSKTHDTKVFTQRENRIERRHQRAANKDAGN